MIRVIFDLSGASKEEREAFEETGTINELISIEHESIELMVTVKRSHKKTTATNSPVRQTIH